MVTKLVDVYTMASAPTVTPDRVNQVT
ncbi:MAG: hypothetical protein RLZZ184_2900, partial [Cyanobacteriota bacterium]